MNLDDKLRAMAHHDSVPLPEDYDNMLTGLYDQLRAEAAPAEKPGRKRKFRLTHLAAAAAVIALMAASMTVGALAFGRAVTVEVPVEVPATQEIIRVDAAGLSLILPDAWAGRYVVETGDDNTLLRIYVKSIYETDFSVVDGETIHYGGLFAICRLDGALTPDQAEAALPMPSDFLLATKDATYLLAYASDVQYNPADAAAAEEYLSMFHQLGEIQVVLDGAMG